MRRSLLFPAAAIQGPTKKKKHSLTILTTRDFPSAYVHLCLYVFTSTSIHPSTHPLFVYVYVQYLCIRLRLRGHAADCGLWSDKNSAMRLAVMLHRLCYPLGLRSRGLLYLEHVARRSYPTSSKTANLRPGSYVHIST